MFGNDLLVAIDGQSVAYRGFHAMRRSPLRNHKGLNTSAVFYFDRLLRDILSRYSPTYGVVGFDSKEPTFRHGIDKGYKAQRPETPDELIPQIEIIKNLAEAWGVKTFAHPGYEADDILAWAALLGKRAGVSVLLVSSDKDLMAMVDDRVKVLNVADERIYDREAVFKKFGIPPEILTDFLVLVGDRTDNLPGIKGIGKKTALWLLRRYGSLKGILANLHDLEKIKPKIAKALKEAQESGHLQKMLKLVSLATEPFFELEDLRIREANREALVNLYRELDFYTALKEVAIEPKLPPVATYGGEEVEGVSFDGSIFFLGDGYKVYTSSQLPEKKLHTTDLKRMYKLGFDGGGDGETIYDLSIADYLLQPEIEEESRKNRHDLEFLALKYKGWRITGKREVFESHLSALIGKEILEHLREDNLMEVYRDVELPLVEVLASMEGVGVGVDVEYLKELLDNINEEITRLKERIFALAGERFNLNSPRQLSRILFEKLGLPPIKRTKTGYSTDVEVLHSLSEMHELPRLLLRYRELFKIKSTYVESFLKFADSSGRIYPTFSQTTTATGRLSCYNPNLQNVPARGEWGKRIRRAFIPERGFIFADYDYSQIELRILAHLSGDKNLREVFLSGGDIHTETAKTLFGDVDVTPSMRRIAKMVNFGIIYGISPYGLSKGLNISTDEAKTLIERYYERFPDVRRWQKEMLEFARQKGYVKTLLGRKRYVYADPFTNDLWRRIVINTPVQGSAADIIKVAMIKTHRLLKGKRSRLLLQIHDELLFEIHELERDLIPKIQNIMEEAISLDVPIEVDVGVGSSWADAHP